MMWLNQMSILQSDNPVPAYSNQYHHKDEVELQSGDYSSTKFSQDNSNNSWYPVPVCNSVRYSFKLRH